MGIGIIENLMIGMTGRIGKPPEPVKARSQSSTPVKCWWAVTGEESPFVLQAKGIVGQEE